jgi:hypothetical protein
MVVQVVETITEAGGRFLKQEGNTENWFAVDKKTAREKVGHSFRDAIKARSCTAVRVEEKLDGSITVKSSFAEILGWLLVKNNAAIHAAVAKKPPVFVAGPANKLLVRPQAIKVSNRAQSDSAASAPSRKSVKRKLPAATSASSTMSLEEMSRRAAHTYMNLSKGARIKLARRAAEEDYFDNKRPSMSNEEEDTSATLSTGDAQALASVNLFAKRTPSEVSDTRSGKVEQVLMYSSDAQHDNTQNAPKSPRFNEGHDGVDIGETAAQVKESQSLLEISPKTVSSPALI